ncbi:hypothetical protein ABZ208_03665 [Streptomyces sp. NPDC006208]|uniref:hypothetical protein n=1 Tax=Streptomyces sp. NPDC006208 TaxID=3156734 RepID=UPI00339E1C58
MRAPPCTSTWPRASVRSHDGTLYFLYATGTADLTGVWRLRPSGRAERSAALLAAGLPNGLALEARTRTLYVTDSTLGTVWRVPTGGGTAEAWSTDPALAPAGFLGANGLKIHNGAVWATNLDKGTVVRVSILADGRSGTARVTATGLTGIDDFAFTGRGDQIIAVLDTVNEVALVRPDGTHTIVLTAAHGLQGPTSIALRGATVYIPSAAYLTAKDPNLRSPSISPIQPSRSASAILSRRLSRISMRRPRWAGSGRSREQRTPR